MAEGLVTLMPGHRDGALCPEKVWGIGREKVQSADIYGWMGMQPLNRAG